MEWKIKPIPTGKNPVDDAWSDVAKKSHDISLSPHNKAKGIAPTTFDY